MMKVTAVLLVCYLAFIGVVFAQQTDVYFTDDVVVPPGAMTEGTFLNLPRPPGDIFVTSLSFQVYCSLTNETIPIEDVYVHHLFLIANTSSDYTILGGLGGQEDRNPLTVPKGFGIYLASNARIIIFYDFINTWGVAASANVTLYIGYNLTWVPNSKSIRNVLWILIDVTGFPNGNGTFKVPNSCPTTNGVYTRQLTFTWPNATSDAVFLIGHLHIGGLSSTLTDSAGAVMCKTLATYDPFNYVENLNSCVPQNMQFVKGNSYTLTIEYKCNGYQNAMGMMAIYYADQM